jgi:hypothetical protein
MVRLLNEIAIARGVPYGPDAATRRARLMTWLIAAGLTEDEARQFAVEVMAEGKEKDRGQPGTTGEETPG